MKLESYRKATPIVSAITEAEELMEKVEEALKTIEDVQSVKITILGKNGTYSISKTLTVKNATVITLVIRHLKETVGRFLGEHEKQLEQIK